MIEIIAFILFCVFWLLFLGRTVMLMRQGVKVFVIAKGKKPHEKALELVLVPFLILWSMEVILETFHHSLISTSLLWNNTLLQWAGVVLCTAGLLIFLKKKFGDEYVQYCKKVRRYC